MTVQDWHAIVALIIGIATLGGIIFAVLRFYIRAFARQELADIRHELMPNSGSSLKDQVTRLEITHEQIKEDNDKMDRKLDKLEEKVDKMFDVILKHFG
jgi:hypothetical protein